MRFLFATLLPPETDFYVRVGDELRRRGHEAAYVTESGHSAGLARRHGFRAFALPDAVATQGPLDLRAESRRIEERYALPTIRDLYRGDRACDGRPEARCVERTVRRTIAVEELVDRLEPDVIVPEVGGETVRMAAHAVGLDRGIPVLFLFYTIFPRPLRLYVDTMHAPIVPADELRPLTPDEELELEAFRRDFTSRAEPIRAHRAVSLDPRRLRGLATFAGWKLGADRDNEYLRPGRIAADEVLALGRSQAARALYRGRRAGRPYLYFPLHVTDDYKIRTLIPHLRDQEAIVAQVADALPPGLDLVVKEHPLSIGRNRLALLARIGRRPNVRLVAPQESSHDLVRDAEGVVVISSTVGLEALLYDKPVLTLGDPFYAGYGVTLDLDSLAGLREGVPALLHFRPDRELVRRFLHAAMRRCYPGAPVQVDASDGNAATLAATLDEAARTIVAERARGAGGGS